MQQPHLKLREIVWEMTGKCNNNCLYCGSKEVRDADVNEKTILEIAKIIAEYPPSEIDMSGGDPLLVSFDVHQAVVSTLKEKSVFCKILFNPKSMANKAGAEEKIKILSLYDWIGISINTRVEFELAAKFFEENPNIRNYTIISNFNAANLYEYEQIESLVLKRKAAWTIQFTVYEDPESELAIYNNDSALDYLRGKVQNSVNKGIEIILSDNLNNASCGAGLLSIGLTHTGDIIPCLSMRSWGGGKVVGNIMALGLRKIWEERFDDYRFAPFNCCKDTCKNKRLNILMPIFERPVSDEIAADKFKDALNDLYEKSKEVNVPVSPWPQVVAYAVYPSGLITSMYAVSAGAGNGTIYNNATEGGSTTRLLYSVQKGLFEDNDLFTDNCKK